MTDPPAESAESAGSGGFRGSQRRPEDERRAAVRRFVLEHHPDRGGDPETFAVGLAALRAGRATDPTGIDPLARGAELRFHRRRSLLTVLVDRIARRGAAERRPPRVI